MIKLLTKMRNMITRGVVDSRDKAGTYQVQWSGGRASAGVENKEPQGLHFSAPANADGITLAPFGDRSGAVLIGASGPVPSGTIAAGEGGLHYLGEWKVFLAADGTLALSAKAPSDWVALASKSDSENAAWQTDVQKLQQATLTAITALNNGLLVPVPATITAFVASTAGVPHTPVSVASAKVKVE